MTLAQDIIQSCSLCHSGFIACTSTVRGTHLLVFSSMNYHYMTVCLIKGHIFYNLIGYKLLKLFKMKQHKKNPNYPFGQSIDSVLIILCNILFFFFKVGKVTKHIIIECLGSKKRTKIAELFSLLIVNLLNGNFYKLTCLHVLLINEKK